MRTSLLRRGGHPAPSGGSAPVDDEPCRDARADHVPKECMEAVLRFCRSRVAHAADAEDAAQGAFMRFVRQAGRGIDNPQAWLMHAADYECRELRRRQARQDARQTGWAGAADETASQTVDAAVSDRLWVEELFRRLSPADRRLLTLRFIADMPVDDVAGQLNVSRGNVRVMTLRARHRAVTVLRAMERGVAAIVSALPLRTLARGHRPAVDPEATARLFVPVQVHGATGVSPWSSRLTEMVTPCVVGAALLTVALLPTETVPHRLPSSPSLEALRSVPSSSLQLPLALTPAHAPSSRSAAMAHRLSDTASPWDAMYALASRYEPSSGSQSMQITSLSPSPHYREDGVAYASALQPSSACSGTCAVLLRTEDGGASWRLLNSTGFLGGRILLPPSGSGSPMLFALTDWGAFQESDDGGATFRLVLLHVSSAAVVPDPAQGDVQVLLGTTPTTVYDATTRTFGAGPLLPAGVSADDIAFLGDEQHVVFTGTTVPASSLMPSVQPAPAVAAAVVGSCSGELCHTLATYPGEGGLRLTVQATGHGSGTVVVYSGSRLDVSNDSGETFRHLGAPTALPIAGVAMAADRAAGPLLVVGSGGAALTLSASSDGGTHFRRLGSGGLPRSSTISTFALLPGGDILAGLVADALLGDAVVGCSTDGGATFHPQCGGDR